MQPMKELAGLTRARFVDEVIPASEPVVIRGLVADWPLVAKGREGIEPCLQYLHGFDRGVEVDALLAKPEVSRAFSFKPALEGFNFLRGKRPLADLFEQLWRYSHFPDPPSLAAQSVSVPDALPGLEQANVCALVGSNVSPRIWLGNRATVPAHFDDSQNIACVAAGTRRFTLFPPHCAPSLYLAPPDYAPTPAPMSVLPNLQQADRQRFPLLERAFEHAQLAELEAGDAIYVPPLWFHQVEALDPHLNILVNYWWRDEPAPGRRDDLHLAAMRLAMLAFRHLGAAERAGWQALFSHYVFGAQGDELAHIPIEQRRLLGTIDANTDAAVRQMVIDELRK